MKSAKPLSRKTIREIAKQQYKEVSKLWLLNFICSWIPDSFEGSVNFKWEDPVSMKGREAIVPIGVLQVNTYMRFDRKGKLHLIDVLQYDKKKRSVYAGERQIPFATSERKEVLELWKSKDLINSYILAYEASMTEKQISDAAQAEALARSIYEGLFYKQAKELSMPSFNKVFFGHYLRKQLCIGRAYSLYSMSADFRERKQEKSKRFRFDKSKALSRSMLAFNNDQYKTEDYRMMAEALDMLPHDIGFLQTETASQPLTASDWVLMFATWLHPEKKKQPVLTPANIERFKQRTERVSEGINVTSEMVADPSRPPKVQEFYRGAGR